MVLRRNTAKNHWSRANESRMSPKLARRNIER